MLCLNEAPRFCIFAYENALSLKYIGRDSDGNELKVIGGVATFVINVKCNIRF